MTYAHFLDRGYPDNYRYAEIQKLVRAIEARESWLVLGLPGIGKSNLLRYLVAKPGLVQSSFAVIFAYLNCEVMDNALDRDAFFEAIATELRPLASSQRQRKKLLRGYPHLQQIVSLIHQQEAQRVVIVVDQADPILQTADAAFYKRLEALTDLDHRVCYIFGASPTLTVNANNSLFAQRWLAVGRLSLQDCAWTIATREAKRLQVNFDAGAQAHLINLTGGYSGLLKAVAAGGAHWTVAEWARPEAELVSALLAQEAVRYRCQVIWAALEVEKQTALQAIAQNQPSAIPPTLFDWLNKFGLIEPRGSQSQLFSPIFREFISALETAPEDAITVKAGRVFRAGKEIQLRQIEQKLLAYLMAHAEQTCTTRELVLAVWGEDMDDPKTASLGPEARLAGVISRLRHKLGKDCIKTYPKKGYAFIRPK